MNELEQKIWAAVYANTLSTHHGLADGNKVRQVARTTASDEVAWFRDFIDKGGTIFNEDLEDRS